MSVLCCAVLCCAVLCCASASGALGTMLPNSHAGVGSGFNMSSGLMVPPVGTSGMVRYMQLAVAGACTAQKSEVSDRVR